MGDETKKKKRFRDMIRYDPSFSSSRREFLDKSLKATTIIGTVVLAATVGVDLGSQAADYVSKLRIPNINVSVINESKSMSDREVSEIMPAIQIQLDRDFGPAWGINAEVKFVPKGQSPEKSSWWLVVADNSDMFGALGYHETTNEGMPLGKVLAKDTKRIGWQPSLVMSHELLEMLADPWINLAVLTNNLSSPNNSTRQTLHAREVCDACEDPKYGYYIEVPGYARSGRYGQSKSNKVLVSDFVFPEWFESTFQPNSTRFDFMGKTTKPFEILSGGYIAVMDIYDGSGWYGIHESEGKVVDSADHINFESRITRRNKPRDQWRPSQVDFQKRV